MKKATKMDANRLIAEVHKRPALWNQRHVLYHNRDVTNRIWTELSTLLKLPKPLLKAKWKGLRDTFRSELKKDLIYRKTKNVKSRPTWAHYKTLHFLKEQMLPRPPVWERPRHVYPGEKVDEDEPPSRIIGSNVKLVVGHKSQIQPGQIPHIRILNANALTDAQCPPERRGQPGRVVRVFQDAGGEGSDSIVVKDEPEDVPDGMEANGDDDSMEYERRDADDLESNDNPPLEQVFIPGYSEETPKPEPIDAVEGNHFDDNYHFLMSLLPHIKKLSGERRMLLRMEIQELVYKEVYKKD